MTTPAITGPAVITQNLAANAKQTDGAVSDVPFNQVLSREVADRNNATEASKASAKDSNAPTQQNQTQSPSVDKSKSATTDHPEKTDQPAKNDTTNTTDTISAEMLALVNNLIHANASNAQSTISEVETKGGKTIASIGTANSDIKTQTGSVDALKKSLATDFAEIQTIANLPLKTALVQAPTVVGQVAAPSTVTPPLPVKAIVATGLETQLPLNVTPTLPDGIQDAISRLKGTTNNVAAASNPNGLVPTNELKTLPDINIASKVQDVISVQSAATAIDLNAQDENATPSTAILGAMQQAGIVNPQSATGHAIERLSPPVGSAGWDQALGQKVVWMVAGGQQSASLTLNPPDLGPLQVVLNVSNSHASATFTAAQPEVRQALEAALPRLREMLADSGIQLGQTSVNAGTPNQFGAPGDQQLSSPRRPEQIVNLNEAPNVSSRQVSQSGGQGLIDTFV